jgi:hypothetical protein
VRRSRRPDDELRARELPSGGRETAGERSLAGEAVRLQELVGNAKTTALLRDATAEAAPVKEGAEERAGSVYTMTLSDIGTFDVESLSFGAARSTPGPGTGGEEKQPQPTELVASKKQDEHSAKLMEYAGKSKPIDTVEIVMQSGGKVLMKIELKNVVIANYSVGTGGPDAIETFTLNFTSIEFSRPHEVE